MKPSMIEIQPPEEISNKIRSAISGALQEEKTPSYVRVLKAFIYATLLASVLLLPIKLLFQDSLESVWVYSGIIWWGVMFIGFFLYYAPHPRLVLPGYFSPSVFAKIMIVMSVANALQILVCPDLAFLESPIGWSPLRRVTIWLMSMGGMKACMLFCGFVFSLVSSFAGFATISRTLKRGLLRNYLGVGALAVLSQLPLFFAQINQEGLKEFVSFWTVGVLLGITLGLCFWRGIRLLVK